MQYIKVIFNNKQVIWTRSILTAWAIGDNAKSIGPKAFDALVGSLGTNITFGCNSDMLENTQVDLNNFLYKCGLFAEVARLKSKDDGMRILPNDFLPDHDADYYAIMIGKADWLTEYTEDRIY